MITLRPVKSVITTSSASKRLVSVASRSPECRTYSRVPPVVGARLSPRALTSPITFLLTESRT